MRHMRGAFGHLLNRKKEEALSHFPIVFNKVLHPPASFPGAWFRAQCKGRDVACLSRHWFGQGKHLPTRARKVSLAESTQSGLKRAEASCDEICSPTSPCSADPVARAPVNSTRLRGLIKSLMKSSKQRAQD